MVNTIPVIVTLIAFDLIYSKFSERYPTLCLGMLTALLAFIKKAIKILPLPLIPKPFRNTGRGT